MRELTLDDARHAVLGGGVLACGGGGWKHHGELMGHLATSLNRPVLARIDELPPQSWVATVTAIGAPAAQDWEIRPVDYVHALQTLIEHLDVPIAAVMTAQNGFSTTLNGWIQSSMLGVPVLDAAGDIRAHPTGKLGSLGLAEREGYVSTQVVTGGNRDLAGHFTSINTGSLNTCDDVLRDISVRTGGFIAAARNPIELTWVKEHAAHGAISLALDLGASMAAAGAGLPEAATAVTDVVCDRLGGTVIDTGPLAHDEPLATRGGWDHGIFRVGEHTITYLNEFMTIEGPGGRVATYPDTIILLRHDTTEALAVKDAEEGMDITIIAVPAARLPTSSSAIDPSGLAECEQIMNLDFQSYLDPTLTGGGNGYVPHAE